MINQQKYNWIAITIETAVEKGIMLDAKAISNVFNVTLKEANGVIDDYLNYVRSERK
jgi:hypothetical protein